MGNENKLQHQIGINEKDIRMLTILNSKFRTIKFERLKRKELKRFQIERKSIEE